MRRAQLDVGAAHLGDHQTLLLELVRALQGAQPFDLGQGERFTECEVGHQGVLVRGEDTDAARHQLYQPVRCLELPCSRQMPLSSRKVPRSYRLITSSRRNSMLPCTLPAR